MCERQEMGASRCVQPAHVLNVTLGFSFPQKKVRGNTIFFLFVFVCYGKRKVQGMLVLAGGCKQRANYAVGIRPATLKH